MQGRNSIQHDAGTRSASGFSLLEVLIVMAIIGILAAVAYPSYTGYVTKSRRADGQIALLQAVQSLERCKASNYSYTGCTLSVSEQTSPEGHYTIALSSTASGYTLTATGTGVQASDTECVAMSVNSQGVRTPAAETGCWPD